MENAAEGFWDSVRNLRWLSNEDIANTVILLLILFVARIIIIRMVSGKTGTLSDTRRRWISVVQNSSILLTVLGLVFIWSPQLSTFALSLTAFAVALVIATKEYLLCVVGAVYRTTSKPFTVGDWVEIHGMRGEVIAEGILTTRLQELGLGSSRFDYTGRILTVPNSLLLTHTVLNESFRKRYLHNQFSVTVEAGIDPTGILEVIKPMLSSQSEEADQLADRYWSMVKQRSRAELPSRQPQVAVETTDIGKITFVVTIFCATADASAIEENLTVHILKAAAQASAEKG